MSAQPSPDEEIVTDRMFIRMLPSEFSCNVQLPAVGAVNYPVRNVRPAFYSSRFVTCVAVIDHCWLLQHTAYLRRARNQALTYHRKML